MFSYEASSTSPEALHHDEVHPATWHTNNLVGDIAEKTLSVLTETREIFVTAEHKMEDICTHLGIHPFHHNFFGNLVGCTLILHTNGHLEIRRE